MFRAAMLAAMLAPASARAFVCLEGGDVLTEWDADMRENCVAACFRTTGNTSTAGCLPVMYASNIDYEEEACNDDACWCLTPNCNTVEWLTRFEAAWVPPPRCAAGVIGMGPSCEATQLYKDSEYTTADCWSRSLSGKCLENNEHSGQGDGCPNINDNWETPRDKASCESYSKDGETRRADESFDGTTSWCRWIPEKTAAERNTSCEVDDKCTWCSSCGMHINGTAQGECSWSSLASSEYGNWMTQRGMNCDMRLKFGCLENNDHLGEDERCTDHKSESVCLGQLSDCHEGTCSGTLNITNGDTRNCSDRRSSCDCDPMHGQCGETHDNGCTWTPQCCQWIPEPTDKEAVCKTKDAGTLAGLCHYNAGESLPGKDILSMGFDHGLLRLGPRLKTKCAIVASFRKGSGAAVALNADKADIVATPCKTGSWKDVAEHTGHTEATVSEYCDNFIPDSSAMAALSANSPGYIIKKAKQGQLDALMKGLQGVPYFVTTRPQLGECLFFAKDKVDIFGAALCVCDKPECNNQTALEYMVDMDVGPMRLLQFIDGSLLSKKQAVNGVVADLLDAEGKVNLQAVSGVTEAKANAIMQISGMSDLCTKDELWGLIQDYKKLLQAKADYKSGLSSSTVFSALKIQADRVSAANAAAEADCLLYGEDGMPNLVCLQHLSEAKQAAVARVTGIPKEKYESGALYAFICEDEGDCDSGKYDEEPAAAPKKEVKGSLSMTVSNAESFVSNAEAKAGVKKGLAAAFKVLESQIKVTFSVVDARRLTGLSGRRASGTKSVKVDYTIEAPASDTDRLVAKIAATPASTVTQEVQAKVEVEVASSSLGSNPFTVTVASIEATTVEAGPSPSPSPLPNPWEDVPDGTGSGSCQWNSADDDKFAKIIYGGSLGASGVGFVLIIIVSLPLCCGMFRNYTCLIGGLNIPLGLFLIILPFLASMGACGSLTKDICSACDNGCTDAEEDAIKAGCSVLGFFFVYTAGMGWLAIILGIVVSSMACCVCCKCCGPLARSPGANHLVGDVQVVGKVVTDKE